MTYVIITFMQAHPPPPTLPTFFSIAEVKYVRNGTFSDRLLVAWYLDITYIVDHERKQTFFYDGDLRDFEGLGIADIVGHGRKQGL